MVARGPAPSREATNNRLQTVQHATKGQTTGNCTNGCQHPSCDRLCDKLPPHSVLFTPDGPDPPDPAVGRLGYRLSDAVPGRPGLVRAPSIRLVATHDIAILGPYRYLGTRGPGDKASHLTTSGAARCLGQLWGIRVYLLLCCACDACCARGVSGCDAHDASYCRFNLRRLQ